MTHRNYYFHNTAQPKVSYSFLFFNTYKYWEYIFIKTLFYSANSLRAHWEPLFLNTVVDKTTVILFYLSRVNAAILEESIWMQKAVFKSENKIKEINKIQIIFLKHILNIHMHTV